MAKRRTKPVKNSVESAKLLAPSELPLPRISPRKVPSCAAFVADDNPDWEAFKGYLSAGASPAAAAACVYIPDATWRHWWNKYRAGDKTPAIRKFGQEVERAIGGASVVAEASEAAKAPDRWLKGPARRLLSEDYITSDKTPSAVLPQSSSTVTNNVLILSAEVQQDALKALEKAGIINMVRRTPDSLVIDSTPSDK